MWKVNEFCSIWPEPTLFMRLFVEIGQKGYLVQTQTDIIANKKKKKKKKKKKQTTTNEKKMYT